MGEQAAVATPGLGTSAVELLGELIRFNTVNPPGNERPAQERLAELLTRAGFECELVAAEPERPNLVARLPGAVPGQTLALLGHVDTVPADPSEWSFDPWAGDVVEGQVRGRGAQDMKGQVAAEVAAAVALGSDGWRPARGELKLIISADEEQGAELGAAWLCAEHPEKARADLIINEGGGASFEVRGKRFYSLGVGEKGIARFRLRARGIAGHASIPAVGENALLKLAPALARFEEQPPLSPSAEGIPFLEAVLGHPVDPDPTTLEAAVEELRTLAREIAAYVAEPMLRVTMVPTRASASDKDNVIPSRAEALVDCRTPPGLGQDEVRELAVEVLGPLADRVDIEFTEDPGDALIGNSSPSDTELAGFVADWLARADPGATLVPIVMSGFSDSHWFRKAFGSAIVYGFCPQREIGELEATPLVHGADERAAVSDIELAASFYSEIAQRVLG
jgi:acetylornithine deacetylase/succinyl-diaminopimelate desuccinylase-like protein